MPENGVPPGTLVMLVLRVLQSGPLHGYAIAQRIHALSTDVLQVEEGSSTPRCSEFSSRDGPGPVGRLGDQSAGSVLSADSGRACQLGSQMGDYERVNAAIWPYCGRA